MKIVVNNKKALIAIIVMVVLIIATIIIGVVVVNNANEKSNNSISNENKQSFPDLSQYGIPKFEAGEIVELSHDNDTVNYIIQIKDISKSDIDNYKKEFDSDWQITEKDNNVIIVKSTRATIYSVVIGVSENEKEAKFVISGLSK